MKIFHYKNSLSQYLGSSGKRIGFVPTMGALHEGHLSLLRASRAESELSVVSIFVNPLQFNNPDDLKKYPRTLDSDLKMLKDTGADVVFLPHFDDLYSDKKPVHVDLGNLAHVFEGSFRPGHFQGVLDVLYALFIAVQPHKVFFGLKDLQQCLVVEKLLKSHFPAIQQINEPTLREASGLAMSSRNARLSPAGLENAAHISRILNSLAALKGEITRQIENAAAELREKGIETEYLNLVSLPDMQTMSNNDSGRRAFVFAGYLEGVRLIDNVLITS